MQFLIIAAFTTVLLTFILLNILIYIFQESLVFQGKNIPVDFQYSFENDFNEIFLEPEDGARIHVIHFKVEEPKGAILYFHGNKSDLRRWGKIAGNLTSYQYDVFVMDYRGYGKSVGERTESKIYKDAELLYRYVKDHFTFQKTVVFGRSLGSAVAVELARRQSVDQLILETPISHINNALFRYRWMINIRVINRIKFDSINKVSDINTPTLLLHGTRDFIVPIRFAKQLMRELATKDKKFIQINKGGHNNLNNFEFYHNSLKQALNNSTSNEKD